MQSCLLFFDDYPSPSEGQNLCLLTMQIYKFPANQTVSKSMMLLPKSLIMPTPHDKTKTRKLLSGHLSFIFDLLNVNAALP